MVALMWPLMSLLGVIGGPFGTSDLLTIGQRLIYWPIIILVAFLVGSLLRAVLRDVLGIKRYIIEAPLLSILAALILAPPYDLFFHWLAENDEGLQPDLFEITLYIFLVAMINSTLRHGLSLDRPTSSAAEATPVAAQRAAATPVQAASEPRQETRNDSEDVPPVTPAEPRLVERLDPDMRGTILRMQVRDHYVDVVTQSGTSSVLMRFADALVEVEGLPGLRVHRSHWVAEEAVVEGQNMGAKGVIVTTDGAQVPVSRTYLRDAMERGLIGERLPGGSFQTPAR
ncbi:LytTR family DNA-binding domain-containing protein [Thioclava sp. SK-1]|uniref:LytTR family DNA-binding domain-containing protein n=1 Tax=Thioclava sp. SK-1 TaxID=1889770 RepID=UPI00159F144A|nr:LytTR family DNA-binding domain-containing protein [Thioclava sp. SK-1]